MTHPDAPIARAARTRRTGRQALLLLAWCTVATAPVLAAGTARPDAAQRYQREQARCMAIRVHGDRANCLSEASTAYQATRPAAADPDPDRYTRNAQARCQALPTGDRQDCLSRMAGQGTTSGSVSGGGLYRELVTREPAVPASGIPPVPRPASAPGQPRPVDTQAGGSSKP